MACLEAESVVPIQEMNKEFPIWANGAPGALGSAEADVPTLTPYLPEKKKATGAAFLVLPGGGYGHLSQHEGQGYAEWLVEQGIAAFVLKYRLGTDGYRHPAMWNDATRAMRTIRANAAQWGLDPERIGVVGSSAGGHLASTLVTHFDLGQPGGVDPVEKVSSRPDLALLLYPVISMGAHAHQGSRTNLLGARPKKQEEQWASSELQVSRETPPCFLVHTWEDASVKMENSMLFADALRAHGVRFELHIFEHGAHGMGLGRFEPVPESRHPWAENALYWLRRRGFLSC